MLKLGDLVEFTLTGEVGTVVGFNKKGEGGKEFVHVLIEGEVRIALSFHIKRKTTIV